MRIMRSIMAGALAVTLATACSDSTAPTGDDLVGTWEATAATFTPVDGTAFDLLADGSGFTLVIRADNTYTVTFTAPDSEPEVENGTYTISGGVLTVTPTDEPTEVESFDVSLNGNTLTMTDDDAVEDDVPGTLRLVLQRQ
jgi:hypothetical protein